MKVLLLSVGSPGRLLAPAIAEYEARAGRYWSLDIVEVKEEKARSGTPEDGVRDAEGQRLLERLPAGIEVIALTRRGRAWSSERLARHLEQQAVHGLPGSAFLIGGAYGLGSAVLAAARHRLSLGPATLPHDLARLLLAEQIYRAGTIVRGEPYHKARD